MKSPDSTLQEKLAWKDDAGTLHIDEHAAIAVKRPRELWPGKFISAMQPGDQLWWFSSPEETWRMLCGRAGYALVRNGDIIDRAIVVMN
jgi:hypothetical protein